MKKNKKITIDDLALMIHKGFQETATKEDIKHLEGKFDKLEALVMQDHRRRIERLEADVRYLKDALAV